MLSWLASPESWSVVLSISFPIIFVSLLTWIIFGVGSAGRMRVTSYLVSRPAAGGTASHDRLMVAAAVTALSLTLFIGALLGASIRQRADAYRESAAYKKYLVDVEREVDAYKRALAFKDAVPDPVGKFDQVLAEIQRRQKEKGQ